MMGAMLALLLRGVVVVAIVVAALVVGVQLRASREQLASGQAASATTEPAKGPVTPTTWTGNLPTATAPSMPPQASPTPAPKRTVVPTPVPTAFTGVHVQLSGTVSAGGKPVRGAQVIVYPANSLNRGPTPVPPEEATTRTDDRGAYRVAVPPGAYRVGVFRFEGTFVPDGFASITWYGDGYAIGLGKDLVVTADATVDIAMLPVVKLAGRVVGRDGVGVPNVHVMLSRHHGGIDFPLVPLGEPLTDGSGSFRLAIAAMPLTLQVQAPGLKDLVWTRIDLDLRGDRTDIVAIIERGHIVRGTLRDAAGRPLANTNFGVEPTDRPSSCGSLCSARTDGAGRFALSVPSGTLRFRNWPQTPSTPEMFSKEHKISGDMTLDPVLEGR
jgi:hypothetical protein